MVHPKNNLAKFGPNSPGDLGGEEFQRIIL